MVLVVVLQALILVGSATTLITVGVAGKGVKGNQGGTGGWPGGGPRGPYGQPGYDLGGANGGGYSGVFIGSQAHANALSPAIAGGGGGGYYYSLATGTNGGGGGGSTGTTTVADTMAVDSICWRDRRAGWK